MKCEKLRDQFMEAVLSGPETASAEVQEHLRTCTTCAGELAALRQTMTLLDEWQAPEPSPYFDARVRACVREEAFAPAQSWLSWFRRPVVGAVAVVLVAVGAGLLELGHIGDDHNTLATNDGVVRVNAPGTAVSDLQYLDKNADLFSEFDALDDQSSTE